MSLFDGRELLVITPGKLTLAEYLGLTAILTATLNAKQAVSLHTLEEIPAEVQKHAKLPDLKRVQKLSPRKYILSFDKGQTAVKSVQWQQLDQKLNFHISVDGGDLRTEGMQITKEGAAYDSILYYQIKSFEQTKSLFAEYPGAVNEATNMSIGTEFAIPNRKLELLGDRTLPNLIEQIYQILKPQGIKAEQATLLLAAIFSITDRFKSKSNAATFSTCTDLLKIGGNLDLANQISTGNKSVAEAGSEVSSAKEEKQKENRAPAAESANQNDSPKQATKI